MATSTLRIQAILRAVDRISRPMRRIQDRVARATRSMRRGFERVTRVTDRMASTIGRTLKRAALGAIVVVTGLTAAVMKLAGSLDDLAKEARRLDFPIDALQEWRFVASQSGVETSAFSKGLQSFAKRLGEAKMGFGTLKEALGRTNPALLRQLINTKNVEGAFELYLDQIRQAPRAVDKIALATTAFGRAGAELVNITHLSTAEIKALRMEQIENGNVTLKQARHAEELIDAYDSMKRSLFGLVKNVFAPLIPMSTKIVRGIREWVVANRELIATKIKEWGQFIVDNWKEIVSWAKKIGKGIVVFFTLHVALKLIIGVLTVINALMTANPIGLIIVAVGALVAGIILLAKNWDEVWLSIKASIGVVTTFFTDQWTRVTNFFRSMWNSFVAFFKTIWDTITGIFTDAVDSFSKSFPNVTRVIEREIKRVGATFKFLGKLFTDIWDGMMNSVEDFTKLFRDEITAVKDFFINVWEGISGFFSGLWDGITDIFQGFIDKTKEALQILGELLGASSGKFQKKFEKNVKVQMEVNPLDVIPDRGGAEDRFKREVTIGRIMELSGKDRAFALDVLKRRDRMLGEQKELERQRLNSAPFEKHQFGIFQFSKAFGGVTDEVKSGTKAQVDAINNQGTKTRGAINKSAKDMAKTISQRYIDVTAPYAHFLRAAKAPAKPSNIIPFKLNEPTLFKLSEPLSFKPGELTPFKPAALIPPKPDESVSFKPGETTSSPQERATRQLIENRESSAAEVTIRDETNRAEVTSGKLSSNIKLDRTGTF